MMMNFYPFTRCSRRLLCAAGLAAMLGFASSAWAHLPVAQCKLEGPQVVCKGGFSDGSGAVGVSIEVLDYDDKVLMTGKLDQRSEFRFDLPEGDFYVFMNAGVGHTVEVDKSDIEGL